MGFFKGFFLCLGFLILIVCLGYNIFDCELGVVDRVILEQVFELIRQFYCLVSCVF